MRTALVTLGAALLLGVAGQMSDHQGPTAGLMFALGGPWIVTAFAVGAITRSALAGTVACGLSVPVYYAAMLGLEHRGGEHYAASMTVLWGASAIICGALFGAAGAAAAGDRPELRAHAVAFLGATLAGEAALFLTIGNSSPLLAAELLLGVLLVLPALRMRPLVALAVTASAATASAVADGALRLYMRSRGWAG